MIRLLNIYTLEMATFEEAAAPPYAVTSHRWQGTEATYEDFSQGRETNTSGHQKIESFCSFMRRAAETLGLIAGHRLDWLWIDTCCIKKSDLAELARAINSMFDCYARSRICLAFLFDVAGTRSVTESSWFDRGWTLQELLAPSLVVFIDSEWNVRGHKKDVACGGDWVYESQQTWREIQWLGPILTGEISRRTRIPSRVLFDLSQLEYITYKEQLGWMKGRRTTHWEDQAYCLLGLIDVSMPLNYGEREHAMIRLLEALLEKCEKRLKSLSKAPAHGLSDDSLRLEIVELRETIAGFYEKRARRRRADRLGARFTGYAEQDVAQAMVLNTSRVARLAAGNDAAGAANAGQIGDQPSRSNIDSFNTLLNQFNELQQQTMTENLEMQKAQAFWNQLESMNKRDATS